MIGFMTTKKPPKKAAKKSPTKKTAKKSVSKVKRTPKAEIQPVQNGAGKPTVTQTNHALVVASSPITKFDSAAFAGVPVVVGGGDIGAHVESIQAVEQKNEELLDEAARHPLAVPEICAKAWDEIRGDDPPFAQCAGTHQEKFLSHAQGIIRGGSPMVGDTQLARFEQAVSRLMAET